jgi:surface antigen
VRVIRRALALLLIVPALHLSVTAAPAAATTAATAPAPGDDYPWRLSGGTTSDAFGFTTRQCVSFVAWRLAQRGTPIDNARQGWGDARDWDDAAGRLGHRVGRVPVVGAIAHWDAYEQGPLYTGGPRLSGTMQAGAYGHVAWVQHVHTDGSVSVVHYNGTGTRTFSVSRVKAPRYLYVGVPVPQ